MGKLFMFLAFVFLVISIASNIMSGSTDVARTPLTAAISDADTTITVASTTGFPDVGVIVIEDERIAYSSISTTQFKGSISQPMLRGTQSTEAAVHSIGAKVSTVTGYLLNTAAEYHLAVLSDSAGLQAFIAKPTSFFRLLGSYAFMPMAFLGTDLQILTLIWAVFGIGMTVALVVSLAGGRRV